VVDLAALRRGGGGGGGGPPFASLAARKLHDAKSTARQVSRTGEAPSRAHTTEIPRRRRGSIHAHQRPQKKAASTVSGSQPTIREITAAASTRAADQALYGTAGSAPQSPSAAAAAAQSSPVPTAASGSPFASTAAPSSPSLVASAAAARALSGEQSLSLNLPYLMRHIQDTGALLDMLFPLQVPPNAISNDGSGAPVAESSAHAAESAAAMVSVQTVSTDPASREAVVALHAALRARLQARRARPTGLCAIRRSIYSDLFSELVRQVTIEEPARGLLLARVRENDEHALRVHAALLREGENYVAGKLLQSTQSVTVLNERLAQLQREKMQLEVRRHDLQNARRELEQHFEERRQLRHAQQQDELNYLRRANQQLSLRLKMETERASAGGGSIGGNAAGGSGEGGSDGGAGQSSAATTAVA
jgi:hypothetical protein